MFSTAKPLAALSSGLLARKGQARPAMRPQGYATLPTPAPVDDLGWNDMGTDAAPAEVALPPVLVERAALRDEVEQPAPEPTPEPVMAEAEPVAEAVEMTDIASTPAEPDPVLLQAAMQLPRSAARGKAAFTLRLDTRRHLRLRLASAVRHRSSQALLIHALDAYLDTLPEVEELARQCSSPIPLGDPR